jgi:CheY-specific phosphatase CheX
VPDQEPQAALAASLESVLERMFFIDTRGEAASATPSGDPPLRVRLAFAGNPCGWLTLEVSPASARSLAADFLAADEQSLSPGQVEDVICELTNMICGAALSRLESGTNFRLGPPRVVAGQPAMDLPDTAARSIDLGTGVLTVRLQFKAASCQSTSVSAS